MAASPFRGSAADHVRAIATMKGGLSPEKHRHAQGGAMTVPCHRRHESTGQWLPTRRLRPTGSRPATPAGAPVPAPDAHPPGHCRRCRCKAAPCNSSSLAYGFDGTMAGEGGNLREDSGKVSRPVVVLALNACSAVCRSAVALARAVSRPGSGGVEYDAATGVARSCGGGRQGERDWRWLL